MKKLTKALLAIGAGAACVATGGLAAPAIGAAIGLTGTAAAHVVAGTAVQRAVDEYNSAYQDICSSGESLYNTRVKAAKTINDVEDLVNSIANHPKTFDTDIGEIKTNRLKFADAQRIAQAEFDNAKKAAT